MIQEVLQQEILTRIDKLAEKLGVTAEYLWPYLVRYEIAMGISVIVGTIMTAIAAGFFWWVYFKSDEEPAVVAAFIVSCITIGLAIFSVVGGIPAIIAPEAAAFKELLP